MIDEEQETPEQLQLPPPAKQPRRVSPLFAITILGVISIVVVVLFHAFYDHEPSRPTGPAITMNSGDAKWTEPFAVSRPVAVAKPPIPVATPQPPIPQMPRQTAQPPVNTQMSEEERLRKAGMMSDVLVKQSNPTQEIKPVALSTPITLTPAPPHTLTPGTMIYAVLQTGLNSDQKGNALARVSQNIMDSVTQTEVLVPIGSTLIGHQNGRAELNENDNSLIVVWDHIVYPDGADVALPNIAGMDQQGYTGFSDIVNHHYAANWGPALAMAGITAASALATTSSYGGYNGYNGEQVAMQGASQSLTGHANARLNSSLQAPQQTIIIRPGYPLRVMILRPLTFAAPYGGAQ